MSLRDTSSASLTATPAEIESAIRWAISEADRAAHLVIRRDQGLSRVASKTLEANYKAHVRALSVIRDRIFDTPEDGGA